MKGVWALLLWYPTFAHPKSSCKFKFNDSREEGVRERDGEGQQETGAQ